MQAIGNEKIDTIWAIELFEHVAEIQKGLKECYRVLKFNSVIVISVPFMYQVHGDPNDYQRWTPSKWKIELNKIGFEVKSLTIFGRFFTILCDFLKVIIKSFPPILKHLGYSFFPFLDLLQKLDDTNYVKKHPVFSKYHSGYFIIATKIK